MQRILTLAFTLALVAGAASAAVDSHMTIGPVAAPKHCVTGVLCGGTCIAKGKTCHKVGPTCTTGIPCGNTCIARGKACHRT
jgi:hypothetical protein